MTRDIRTITPNASAIDARGAMRTAGVRHLVVVDKGDLVGIVSDRDLGRGVERPIERSTRWTLRARGVRGAGPTERHARRA